MAARVLEEEDGEERKELRVVTGVSGLFFTSVHVPVRVKKIMEFCKNDDEDSFPLILNPNMCELK